MHDEIRVSLAKGCLAGMGLALAFFLAGVLLYLAAHALGLEQSVSLVIGIAGGPMLVSAVVLGGIVMRAQSRTSPPASQDADFDGDATATWDDA